MNTDWAKEISSLASGSGFLHDLGKYNTFFQNKLRASAAGSAQALEDPVRHEWISLLLIDQIIQDFSKPNLCSSLMAPYCLQESYWLDLWHRSARFGAFLTQGASTPLSASMLAPRLDEWKRIISQTRLTTISNSLSDESVHASLHCETGIFRFLVASHHKLFGDLSHDHDRYGESFFHVKVDKKESFGSSQPKFDVQNFIDVFTPLCMPSPEVWAKSIKAIARRLPPPLPGAPTRDENLKWRGRAIIARSALILSDHHVSSRIMPGVSIPPEAPKKNTAYANTDKIQKLASASSTQAPDAKGRFINQTLDWHVSSVGEMAAQYFRQMMAWPSEAKGLSPHAAASIDQKASDKFVWQENAAQETKKQRHLNPDHPMLLFVSSGTGSGKTRACARLAIASAMPGEEGPRFCTLLNLRTLTLQTGAAYQKQLNIPPDEMTVVVGDRLAKMAFEEQQRHEGFNDDDADERLGDVPSYGGALADWTALPPWIDDFLADNSPLKKILAAPVAVCTTDYLIGAAEPHLQHRSILPMLRLMSSDLILDEVDGYDPPALVAIFRLVQMAAFWNRNVIASSATLSPIVASALCEAYASGTEMRARTRDVAPSGFICGLIDDDLPCAFYPPGQSANLILRDKRPFPVFQAYMDRLEKRCEKIENRQKKRKTDFFPYDKWLTEQKGKGWETVRQSWFSVMADAAMLNHGRNCWPDRPTHKQVSVGLIRVANVSTAIDLAVYLDGYQPKNPNGHPIKLLTCAYHSALFKTHRLMIEEKLDRILSRNIDANAPALDPVIRAALDDTAHQDVCLIVVATPVEEIGRDHDFDWCVAELSSSHSIVQTAGRVARHRDIIPDHPNFSIVKWNLRQMKHFSGESKDVLAFIRPGNEILAARIAPEFCANKWVSTHQKDENNPRSAQYFLSFAGTGQDAQPIEHVDARICFSMRTRPGVDDSRSKQYTPRIAMTRFDTTSLIAQLIGPLNELVFKTDSQQAHSQTTSWIRRSAYDAPDRRFRDHSPKSSWLAKHDGQFSQPTGDCDFLFYEMKPNGEWSKANDSVVRKTHHKTAWIQPDLLSLHNKFSAEEGLGVDIFPASKTVKLLFYPSFGFKWEE